MIFKVGLSALLVTTLLATPARAQAGTELEDSDSTPTISQQRAREAVVEPLLSQADTALVRGWLVTPVGRSAMDLYLAALELDPDNAEARDGLSAVFQATLEAALLLAREVDFEGADALLGRADLMEDSNGSLSATRERIQRLRDDYLNRAESDVRTLISNGEFVRAEEQITDLIAIGLPRERLRELRRELSYARVYGSFRPGQTLRDPLGGDPETLGPTLVVIPSGQYMMGSPESEADRLDHEGPRHRVVMPQGFALAKTETTVSQFAQFVAATGYVTDAERAGWSRVYDVRSGRMSRRSGISWRQDYRGDEADPDLPVIHVSWRDARAYADWLAELSGLDYRLPTEAEFEYALRAGTQSAYWWGNASPDSAIENLTGEEDFSPNGAQWNVAFKGYGDDHWGPAPAASYSTNPFGLHDMSGNVMEWVEDCWHDSFVRAPSDGSAWVNPGCRERVIRGGSWSSTPGMSRSAYRLAGREDSTDIRVGFRVARDL
ncbi:MAG: formylglycine-generating enzyme family protein [Wenzhouxiangella sp.]|jgi:formylglycine-generating enzyme required for sulfatase activity|nr:formylglycine-generating enzyme family protein [Wenzhouxiangella sp.]